MRDRRWHRLAMRGVGVSVAAAAAVVAVGCGSDGDSSGQSGQSGSDGASKAPVQIMTVAPISGASFTFPAMGAAAKAAVADINASGGLAGHPIKLDVCDSRDDANTEVACFRKAVDGDTVAIVGQQTNFNPAAAYALADSAKLPVVGGFAGNDPSVKAAMSFPTSAGDKSAVAGMVYALAKHGCQKVGLLVGGDAAVAKSVFIPAIEQGAKWAGIGVVDPVVTPVKTPDVAPYVKKVLDNGAGCIALVTGVYATVEKVNASAKTQPTKPLVAVAGAYPQPQALANAASRKNLQDLLVVAHNPPETLVSDGEAYVAAVNKYVPGGQTDGVGFKTWGAFQTLKAIAAKGAITRESIIKAMSTQTVPTGFGGPEVNMATPAYDASAPRVKSPWIFATKVVGDKIAWDDAVSSSSNHAIDVSPAYK